MLSQSSPSSSPCGRHMIEHPKTGFRSPLLRPPHPHYNPLLVLLFFLLLSVFVVPVRADNNTIFPSRPSVQPEQLSPRSDRDSPAGVYAADVSSGDPVDQDPQNGPLEPSRTSDPESQSPSQSAFSTPTFTGIPRPFDSSIGTNFTEPDCPTFIRRFSTDPDLINCVPVSLLLQTSHGFFLASKSHFQIASLLDTSCSVDADRCAKLLDSYHSQLPRKNVCRADLELGNPIVVQAQNGLKAYRVLFQAMCLIDSEQNIKADSAETQTIESHYTPTDTYCYVNAVTNTTSAADVYPYHLPLGLSLPGGNRQSCSPCTQRTFRVFAAGAQDSSQPIHKTYSHAAKTLNLACGPGFVQEGLLSSLGVPKSVPAFSYLVLFSLLVGLYLTDIVGQV